MGVGYCEIEVGSSRCEAITLITESQLLLYSMSCVCVCLFADPDSHNASSAKELTADHCTCGSLLTLHA